MGAAHGVSHLLKLGLPVIGVSGRLTGSPLAAREAAAVCSVPIFGTAELRDPVTSSMLAGLAVPSTPREEPTEASQQSDRVIDLLQNRIHEG